MRRIAAWLIDILWRITDCGRSKRMAEFDDYVRYVMEMPAEPQPEPAPVIQQVTYQMVDMECEVAATRPRAACWYHLTLGNIEMTATDEETGRCRIVDHPIEQWRVVYGGTAFESLS